MAAAAEQPSTTGLEPGLHQDLRVLTVLQVLGTLLVRPSIGRAMGVDAPLGPSLLVALPVPLFLLALVWIPSWQGRRGRVLLPLALGLASANLFADKFLTLSVLNSPAQRELNGVLLMVRLWLIFHTLTLIVTWQYRWRVAVA